MKKVHLNQLSELKTLIIFGFLSFVSYWYMISSGTFSFFEGRTSPESLIGRASYFSAEAISIIHGKWSIDPAIFNGSPGDCFQYRTRCEGYFGLFPSLIRIPQELILNSHNPSYSIAYQLSAIFLFIIASIFLFHKLTLITKFAPSQFQFGFVLLASPIIYLGSRGYVYEEAILWGITWFLVTIVISLYYLQNRREGIWWISLLTANLALQSRIVEGLSSLLLCTLTWLFIHQENFRIKNSVSTWLKTNKSQICGVIYKFVALAMSGAFYLFLNFWKFGVVLPSILHSYGVSTQPKLKALVLACRPESLAFIPENLIRYVIPNFRNWPFGFSYTTKQFGFFGHGVSASYEYLSCASYVEAYSPISVTYLFSSVAALIGLVFLYKHRRDEWSLGIWIIIAAALSEVVLLSSFMGSTERYIAEFIPILLIFTFFGIYRLQKINNFIYSSLIYSLIPVQIITCYLSSLSFYYFWNDRPLGFDNLFLYHYFSKFFIHVII